MISSDAVCWIALTVKQSLSKARSNLILDAGVKLKSYLIRYFLISGCRFCCSLIFIVFVLIDRCWFSCAFVAKCFMLYMVYIIF